MSAELHRGKLAQHPKVISVRKLEREDLARLREKRVGPARIKSLREPHHRLARLIATGLSEGEIASRTGYSTTRIGVLKADPAFAQLVSEYKEKVDERWLDSVDEFFEAATTNMLRAERQIEAHLDAADDEGSLIPLKTLLSLTADRADRFGYGKHSTSTSEVKDFARIMELAAKRSGRSNVIDAPTVPNMVSASPEAGAPPLQPPGQFADVGFRRRIVGRQG